MTDRGGAKLGTRHAEVVEAIYSGGKRRYCRPRGKLGRGDSGCDPPCVEEKSESLEARQFGE